MYLQVSGVCGDTVSSFVSYVRSYRHVTSRTLSGWIRVVLTCAGVVSHIWKPHLVRSVPATHQTSIGSLDFGQIGRLLVGPLSSGVFKKFYNRYL